ncbi:hypothetical protein TPHA_0A05770 [Tetrapisispora phaffii CBS 4417]|uniref:Carboxypeptidase n=1 Tax=Tetrapisispora phaffii (strain ATCC 24235 / CBS 4417 / NBRC 1672 / NRRL Y-8282 / UCD 70-5) TaxID=1071381 RepID=G8BP23_TETPH|nr:hypothetical protein TPHA_0A05770 [Tetrapisispora phaffii CBS 4417]CCE61651.1 hypothetical protein TPHA_0A05770 [Tetrapisispora phaffii CBS 4417]
MHLLVHFLFLSQFVTALLTANDYSVAPELLPGISSIKDESQIPIMFSGLIPLFSNSSMQDSNKDKDYFFWKFKKRDVNSKRLIIWFNGGPGCSSMDGALAETGPFRVDPTGKLYLNEGSWYNRADMVFVDQPVGTGFSSSTQKKTNFDNDLELVSEHFMSFLINYFTIFPGDLEKELLLAGESYAGQYIPYFAKAITKYNEGNNDKKLNLKAMLIGNGWIDPTTQSLSYVPFALENNIINKESSNFHRLLQAHEQCQNKINSKKEKEQFSYPECDRIINALLLSTRDNSPNTPASKACLNVYDFKLRDSYPACGMNWPADIAYIPKFFSKEGVLEALNLDPSVTPKWGECNDDVLKRLTNPTAKPSIHYLPELLKTGIEIILYNGANDIICNNIGVLDSIEKMQWGGSSGFTSASEYYEWVYRDLNINEDQKAGFIHYDKNLTFISVYNASHMVPNDRSLISRGILDIYMNNVISEIDENGGETLITTSDDNYSDDDDQKQVEKPDINSDYYDYDYAYDYYYYNDGVLKSNENGSGSEGPRSHPKAKITLALVFLLMIVAILSTVVLQNRSQRRRPILRDPNRRHPTSNKTVSWDVSDDDIDFALDNDEVELAINPTEISKNSSKSKTKNGYTAVSNDEDNNALELQDI